LSREQPPRVPKILQELIDPPDAVHPIHVFANQRDVPEPVARSPSGGGRRHPRTGIAFGKQFGVRVEFRPQILVEPATPQRGAEPRPESGEPDPHVRPLRGRAAGARSQWRYVPMLGLARELTTAGCGDRVVLRAPVVLGNTPARSDPAL